MSNFYGKASAFNFSPTIASNTANYNLKSAAIAAGWNQVLPLNATVTINSGVYVYSTSTGAYAFQTGVTFPAGSVLRLINNGIILGGGGNGSSARIYATTNLGTAPTTGGPALLVQQAITITNNGVIGGGGGGGGSGGHN
jgi:hypothetical protein